MQKLTHITSTAIPLPTENIDTDQIIPARFLKSIDKNGFGQNVFRDVDLIKKIIRIQILYLIIQNIPEKYW